MALIICKTKFVETVMFFSTSGITCITASPGCDLIKLLSPAKGASNRTVAIPMLSSVGMMKAFHW